MFACIMAINCTEQALILAIPDYAGETLVVTVELDSSLMTMPEPRLLIRKIITGERVVIIVVHADRNEAARLKWCEQGQPVN